MPPWLRKAMAGAMAAAALVFSSLHAFGWRQAARESSTGATWWDILRPVHAGLYLAAASWTYSGAYSHAASALAADVVVGMVAGGFRNLKV